MVAGASLDGNGGADGAHEDGDGKSPEELGIALALRAHARRVREVVPAPPPTPHPSTHAQGHIIYCIVLH
jgi:hypothetical protein